MDLIELGRVSSHQSFFQFSLILRMSSRLLIIADLMLRVMPLIHLESNVCSRHQTSLLPCLRHQPRYLVAIPFLSVLY